MSRISKEDMVSALIAAGVNVPATASLSQLSSLYLEVISEPSAGEQSAVLNGTNRIEISNVSSETAVNSSRAAPADYFQSITATEEILPTLVTATNLATSTSEGTSAPAQLPPTAAAVHLLPTTAATAHLPSTAAAVHLLPTTDAAANLPSTASAAHFPPIADANHLQLTATDANPRPTAATINLPSTDADSLVSDGSPAIKAEIQRLRQLKEQLQLQREVSELQIKTRGGAMPDVEHIEAMVSPFSADDNYSVEKWVCDLEDAFEILALDERARFIAARRLLTGTARVLMRTVSTSSYAQLKSLLIEEFGHSCTNQEVFTQLRDRRLKHGETTKRYVLEMQEIAARGRVTETELIDLIIGALADSRVNTTMLYGAANMRELKALLERQERIRPAVARVIQPQQSNLPVTAQMPTTSANTVVLKPKTTAAPPPAASMNEVRCFNCSKYGHFQSQCPKPKRPEGSCFRCGNLDHVYRQCASRV